MTYLKGFKEVIRGSGRLHVVLDYYMSVVLSASLRQALFSLLKGNMETLYNDCPGWIWNDKTKLREMLHPHARFLVATQPNIQPITSTSSPCSTNIAGYIHWRFLLEDNERILYIWEVQIKDGYRRLGLGRTLMQMTEIFAWKMQFDKIVLTVFKKNVAAVTFFRNKMLFAIDETDPTTCNPQGHFGYLILSKKRPTNISTPS